MRTTIRAAIMLAVLVGLPAAWVYYGPLPPQAQRVVDRFVTAAKEAVDWDRLTAKAPAPRRVAPIAMARPVDVISPPPIETTTSPAQAPQSLTERVEPLVAQLRDWGVNEYRLEPWGSAQMYRFSCEMPLADGAEATQQFEAVAADPMASVAQVVSDVQSWRGTQLTAMR